MELTDDNMLTHFCSCVFQGGKFGMVQPPYPGLVMYNDFTQPPPAHMGIPPVHTDPKTGQCVCVCVQCVCVCVFSVCVQCVCVVLRC